MAEKEWVMPTHIIAVSGVVTNKNGEVLMVKTHNSGWVLPGGETRPSEENSETQWVKKEEVLSRITSASIIERFQAYLEYDQRPVYMEYVTYPAFELKLKTNL